MLLLKCKFAVIKIPIKLFNFHKQVFFWIMMIMMYSSNFSLEILSTRADFLNKNKSLLGLASAEKNGIFLQSYENKYVEFYFWFGEGVVEMKC